jgi:benzylsuccinate CoA-transferase BbsE subunit
VTAISDDLAERVNASMLDGVKVIDRSGPEGAYGGRLLADLGADVVRIEPRGQLSPRPSAALLEGPSGVRANAFERFVGLNTRSMIVDLTQETGVGLLRELTAQADVVLSDGSAEYSDLADRLVWVDTSTFGCIGEAASLVGDDLIGLAAGGLLSLGGYPDAEPIAVYGEQALLAGGMMTATAALLGLLGRDNSGHGEHVDVSVQATIVGALEDATAEFDLIGTTRSRSGDRPREAGTGIFCCADGWIAIVAGKLGTAPAWAALVAWLIEEGTPGSAELAGEEWTTIEHRRRDEAVRDFTRIFESFTLRHPKAWLYAEGQRRAIAMAPVNGVDELLREPQLVAREYFSKVFDPVLEMVVTYPGPPYRLNGYPRRAWTAAPARGADSRQVIRDWLGLSDQRIDTLFYNGIVE